MPRLTQIEFARLCGVHKSTVSRWLKNGRIEADSNGLIDPDAAQRMRETTESPLPHHQARKAQFDEARTAAADATAATAVDEAAAAPPAAEEEPKAPSVSSLLSEDLKRHTVALQKAKAEQANLELDKAAGAVLDRAEVDFALEHFGATLRNLLESLPDRIAGELASHQGDVPAIHKTLEDSARDLLTEMSETMRRTREAWAS